MSLREKLYLLLSTGSTQEYLSLHDWKIVDWDVKNQTKLICFPKSQMMHFELFQIDHGLHENSEDLEQLASDEVS